MQDVKEEVRSKVVIEEVIGEYVQLKRAGRNFKGLSPFTGEKTASFYVSPEKNIWHDFSSNKGGDVFSFVMEVEGLDFRGALELLARRAGVDISVYDSKGAQEIAAQKRKLLEIHELACVYYQQSLAKNTRALDYVFKKRKLSKDVVGLFRIGYAPDATDALVRFLKKKGYSGADLSKAGLTNRRGGDLFRARMMVPLMDQSGRVIGFTGRILKDEPNAPKYLNTPQTLIYDKGRHVFGLSQAKEAIRKNNHAVIVEGNLDVVSSHQALVFETVATAGTAMTEWHIKALSRLTPNIKLAFDGDGAGIAATERAIPIAQKVGVELLIVSLTEGFKDPDELIQKDANLWQDAIDNAEPVIDWLFKQYSSREDMSTPKGKRQFTTAALSVVREINDPVEQEVYLKQIAEKSSTSMESIAEKLGSKKGSHEISRKPKPSLKKPIDEQQYQNNIMAIALIDDDVKKLLSTIDIAVFSTTERKSAYEYFTTEKGRTTRVESLQENENYVNMLKEFVADRGYRERSKEELYEEATQLIRRALNEHLQTKKTNLTNELRIAEDNGDSEAVAKLLKELNELIKTEKESARGKRQQ